MSITRILNYNNPRFKEYRSTLAKYRIPKFTVERFEIKAIPQTQNYALIGIAFDYLLRFTVEKNFNKYIIGSEWIAEKAINYLIDDTEVFGSGTLDIKTRETILRKKKKLSNPIKSRFAYVKEVFYYNYVNNYKSLDIDLIKGCLFLAKLDLLAKNRSLGLYEIDFLYENSEDVADMRTLIEICDINIFKPKKKIRLNPTFGNASLLVGGADADIIIDDILIDIKVTKQLKITRNYYNQIISYYLLHLIEKAERSTDLIINKLGFYFA